MVIARNIIRLVIAGCVLAGCSASGPNDNTGPTANPNATPVTSTLSGKDRGQPKMAEPKPMEGLDSAYGSKLPGKG
jgi:hypothetical protein